MLRNLPRLQPHKERWLDKKDPPPPLCQYPKVNYGTPKHQLLKLLALISIIIAHHHHHFIIKHKTNKRRIVRRQELRTVINNTTACANTTDDDDDIFIVSCSYYQPSCFDSEAVWM